MTDTAPACRSSVGRTRLQSSSSPARPNIWRLIILMWLTRPSTGPEFHRLARPWVTASRSCARPLANDDKPGSPAGGAAPGQGGAGQGNRGRWSSCRLAERADLPEQLGGVAAAFAGPLVQVGLERVQFAGGWCLPAAIDQFLPGGGPPAPDCLPGASCGRGYPGIPAKLTASVPPARRSSRHKRWNRRRQGLTRSVRIRTRWCLL